MEQIKDFPLPDLLPAFNRGLEAMDVPRGDEESLHVSDLGKCDFAVWARRNGEPMIAHGPVTRARLQMGLHAEEFVIARIEAGLPPGWLIERAGTVVDDDGVSGHLDAILARYTHPGLPGECATHVGRIVEGARAGEDIAIFGDRQIIVGACVVERAYFDVKTTGFQEKWVETGEFYPDTGKPVKRRQYVPYEDFPGPHYHFQAGGYCRRMPRNPDGRFMPYAIAAFDWNSKTFVPFGWFDSNVESFALLHDLETKRKLEVTAPGVDPVAAGIATARGDGLRAGIPPEDSYRKSGKSWMCGYCDYADCALNTNPDAEVL